MLMFFVLSVTGSNTPLYCGPGDGDGDDDVYTQINRNMDVFGRAV